MILFEYSLLSLRSINSDRRVHRHLFTAVGRNVLSIARLSPFPDLDVTPIVFTLTAIVILYDCSPAPAGHPAHRARPAGRKHERGLLVLDNDNRVWISTPPPKGVLRVRRLTVGQRIDALMTRGPTRDKYIVEEQLDTEIELDGNPPSFPSAHQNRYSTKKDRLLGR